MENVIERVLSRIKNLDNDIIIADDSYKAVRITKDNFHEIKNTPNKNIVFIDGGNAELIKTPNLSLQFIRIYSCIYFQNKKISDKIIEFYIIVHIENQHFRVELIPITSITDINPKDLELNINDETIKEGISLASLPKIGELARRIAEISLAVETTKDLDDNDIIVLDGSLEPKITNEKKYLDKLYLAGKNKNLKVSALSKSSRLLTQGGKSMLGTLASIAPQGKWYYYPAAITSDTTKYEIYFIKLHSKSKHIFRFEIQNNSDINLILSNLARNSIDAIFPGYPYGLIIADKFARVSENEKNYLLTILEAKSGKNWRNIQTLSSSLNVHDILDNI